MESSFGANGSREDLLQRAGSQRNPPGPPDEVWARVTPIIDASAPKVLALRMRAMLAAMSHALYMFTLGDIYERQEQDPYTGAHLFAAISAMRADEHEGGIERMRQKADELDPS
ncbi:hypothetical protein ABZX92_42435 [Lentzea sp. NPDC006480]|uniref:hypothetical protein n=1 Tax=Lentzea sp. NPDC006480 TaxID=3157176 RepID=UPI0033B7E79D